MDKIALAIMIVMLAKYLEDELTAIRYRNNDRYKRDDF